MMTGNIPRVKIDAETRSQEEVKDGKLHHILSRSPLRDHISISHHRVTESEQDENVKLMTEHGEDKTPRAQVQK